MPLPQHFDFSLEEASGDSDDEMRAIPPPPPPKEPEPEPPKPEEPTVKPVFVTQPTPPPAPAPAPPETPISDLEQAGVDEVLAKLPVDLRTAPLDPIIPPPFVENPESIKPKGELERSTVPFPPPPVPPRTLSQQKDDADRARDLERRRRLARSHLEDLRKSLTTMTVGTVEYEETAAEIVRLETIYTAHMEREREKQRQKAEREAAKAAAKAAKAENAAAARAAAEAERQRIEAAKLHARRFGPEGVQLDVNAIAVAIEFDHPPAVAGARGLSWQPTLTPEPSTPGKWRLDGNRFMYDKKGPWDLSTVFTVEVPSGIRSGNDQPLSSPVRFSFKTPTPTLTSFFPRPGGGRAFSKHTPVWLCFSQPVNPNDVLAAVSTVSPRKVRLRLLSDEESQAFLRDPEAIVAAAGAVEGNHFAFAPRDPWPAGSSVSIAVGPGVCGARGNTGSIATDQIGFNILPDFLPLHCSSTGPPQRERNSAPRHNVITVNFSLPLAATGVPPPEWTPEITPTPPRGSWHVQEGNNYVYTVDEPNFFPRCTTFTVRVPRGVAGAAGTETEVEKSFTIEPILNELSTFAPLWQNDLVPVMCPFFLLFTQPIRPADILPKLKLKVPGMILSSSIELQELRSLDAVQPADHIPMFAQDPAMRLDGVRWLAVIPSQPMPHNTDVTFEVAKGLAGAEGPDVSDLNYSFTFTTTPKFEALRTSFLRANDKDCIEVQFSQTLPRNAAGEPVWTPTIAPVPAGGGQWIVTAGTHNGRAVQHARYVPTDRLALSTRYTVAVEAGAISARGDRTAARYTEDMKTATIHLLETVPSGAVGLRSRQEFMLLFDQPITARELLPHLTVEANVKVRGMVFNSTQRTTHTMVGLSRAEAEQVRKFADHLARPNWVAVRPETPLPLSATVTLRLAAGLRATGAELAADEPQEFTVRTCEPFALTVLRWPGVAETRLFGQSAERSTGLGGNDTIRIELLANHPLNTAGGMAMPLPWTPTVTPALPIDWTVRGRGDDALTLCGTFAGRSMRGATEYVVTIPGSNSTGAAAVTSALDEPLAENFRQVFKTPATTSTLMFPAGGALVPCDTAFLLIFDQPINPAAVMASGAIVLTHTPSGLFSRNQVLALGAPLTREELGTSSNIPADVLGRIFYEPEAERRWLAFRAAEPLPRDADVLLTVTGAPSTEGPRVNEDADFRTSFHVLPAFEVQRVNLPLNQATGRLVVVLSQPVDSRAWRPKLTPEVDGAWDISEDGGTYNFTPTRQWTGATRFTVKIKRGLRAASGETLGETTEQSWETDPNALETSYPSSITQNNEINTMPVFAVVFRDQVPSVATALRHVEIVYNHNYKKFCGVREMHGGDAMRNVPNNRELHDFIRLHGERVICFEPSKQLPGGTPMCIHVGPGIESVNGPLRSVNGVYIVFRTVEDLIFQSAFITAECAFLHFNQPLNEAQGPACAAEDVIVWLPDVEPELPPGKWHIGHASSQLEYRPFPLMCTRNHELLQTIHAEGGYARGWTCDLCRRNIETTAAPGGVPTPRWHCRICRYDVCVDCYTAFTTGRICKRNHPLRLTSINEGVYAANGWACDTCHLTQTQKRDLEQSEDRWCCATCTYDICLTCMQQEQVRHYFPFAQTYKFEVAAGSTLLNGAVMRKTTKVTASTSVVHPTSIHPAAPFARYDGGNYCGVNQLFRVAFNQAIDSEAMCDAGAIAFFAGKARWTPDFMRSAYCGVEWINPRTVGNTPGFGPELARHRDFHLYFKPARTLPHQQYIQIRIGPKLRSREGPDLSTDPTWISYLTPVEFKLNSAAEVSQRQGDIVMILFSNNIKRYRGTAHVTWQPVGDAPPLIMKDCSGYAYYQAPVYRSGRLRRTYPQKNIISFEARSAAQNRDCEYVAVFDPHMVDEYDQPLTITTGYHLTLKAVNFHFVVEHGRPLAGVSGAGPAARWSGSVERDIVTLDPFPMMLPRTHVGHMPAPTFHVFVRNVCELRVCLYRLDPAADYANWMSQHYIYNEGSPKKPDTHSYCACGTLVHDVVIEVVDYRPEQDMLVPIDLTPALRHGVGHVGVVVRPTTRAIYPNVWNQSAVVRRWVQVTRIGLDVVVGPQEALCWANDIVSGDPLAGVSLRWIEDNNQTSLPYVGQAAPPPEGLNALTTNADGLVALPCSTTNKHILAQRAGDVALIVPWIGAVAGVETVKALWHVFDDRGMYRPKAEAQIKGYVRLWHVSPAFRADRRIAPTCPFVQYKLFDARRAQIIEGEVPINTWGAFSFALALPETINLGTAYLELELGGKEEKDKPKEIIKGVPVTELKFTHTFKVQEFRTPEFKASAAIKSEPAQPGFTETVDGEERGVSTVVGARAQYFSGPSLPDAEIAWRVHASRAKWAPPGQAKYDFGLADAFSGSGASILMLSSDSKLDITRNFTGRTGEKGKHRVRVKFNGGTPNPPTSVAVLATADIQDLNRQTLTTDVSYIVHASEYYVGVYNASSFAVAQSILQLEMVVVNRQGVLVAGRDVRVQAVFRVDSYGQTEYVEEHPFVMVSGAEPVVVSIPTSQANAKEMTITFTLDGPPNVANCTRLRMKVEEPAPPPPPASQFDFPIPDGRSTMPVAPIMPPPPLPADVPGLASMVPADEESITITSNRPDYLPGDNIELLLETTFAPASICAAVYGSNGVLAARSFHLRETRGVISFPAEESFAPNVRVRVFAVGSKPRPSCAPYYSPDAPNQATNQAIGATVVPPIDADHSTPHCSVISAGSIEVKVSTVTRRMEVIVTPDESEVYPGATVGVSVRVLDARGRPVPGAELALAVVDDAVLALAGYTPRSLLDSFYPQRQLGPADGLRTSLRRQIKVSPWELVRPPQPEVVEGPEPVEEDIYGSDEDEDNRIQQISASINDLRGPTGGAAQHHHHRQRLKTGRKLRSKGKALLLNRKDDRDAYRSASDSDGDEDCRDGDLEADGVMGGDAIDQLVNKAMEIQDESKVFLSKASSLKKKGFGFRMPALFGSTSTRADTSDYALYAAPSAPSSNAMYASSPTGASAGSAQAYGGMPPPAPRAAAPPRSQRNSHFSRAERESVPLRGRMRRTSGSAKEAQAIHDDYEEEECAAASAAYGDPEECAIEPEAEEEEEEPSVLTVRSNFNPLAHFTSSVMTDAEGLVRLEIHVPDSLTCYRLMALAVSADNDRYGYGDQTMTAALPLVLRVSPPRFLNVGDEAELTVIVQNTTKKDRIVRLAIRASSLAPLVHNMPGGIMDCGQAGLMGIVLAGRRRMFPFKIRARRPGPARFVVSCLSQGYGDAADVTFPVLVPPATEQVASYGQLGKVTTTAVQPIRVPPGFIEDFGSLEVAATSTQLQNLMDGVQHLFGYEYDSCEAIASRLIVLVSMSPILEAFGLPNKDETASRVKDGLALLSRRQHSSGAFGMWGEPVNRRGVFRREVISDLPPDVELFVTAHVAHCMAVCAAQGSSLPGAGWFSKSPMQKNVTSYLEARVAPLASGANDGLPFEDRDAGMIYGLYALHRLASAAGGSKSSAKEIRKMAENFFARQAMDFLPLEVLAWLLSIFAAPATGLWAFVFGNKVNEEATATAVGIDDSAPAALRYAGMIMRYIEPLAVWNAERTEARFASFYSPTDAASLLHSEQRTSAVLLEAMAVAAPENPLTHALARALLLDRKNGKWDNTQSNCWACLALYRYFAAVEKDVPDFILRTWVGEGAYCGKMEFKGRSVDTQTLRIPMQFINQASAGDKALMLNKDGKGRLYYRLSLRLVPTALEAPPVDAFGFKVTRTYEPVIVGIESPAAGPASGASVEDAPPAYPEMADKDTPVLRKDGLWRVRKGALIRVRISVTPTNEAFNIALVDRLPAGLEQLPPNFVLPKKPSEKKSDNVDEELPSYEDIVEPITEGWWEHENMRDDRTECFAGCLAPALTFVYTYVVRATTPGRFVVPPARIEELYTPEVFGQCAWDHMVVE